MKVFFCTCAKESDPIRWHLAQACLWRWKMEAEPIVLTPELLNCSRTEFMGEQFRYAEENGSELYIVADDDCMPIGKDFIERGMNILKANPEYANLAASVHYVPADAPEVFASNGGGGARFVRRGMIEVPKNRPRVYDDCALSADLKARGWLTGYMRDVHINHLGHKLSTVWPDDYASGRTQI